ncbi:MAG: hypothetical protein BWY49_00446 [Candidatus Omnitrophica bacterium ADurb.Bin314]|nr:MAG: hypothetical protein BWY49_00446 [Candidatus Omnitrophica bacterium ADurb.Bin314]
MILRLTLVKQTPRRPDTVRGTDTEMAQNPAPGRMGFVQQHGV